MKSALRSLVGRLTRDLLLTVGAIWLAAAMLSAWYVRAEITEGFDSALLQSAYKLLDLVDHELEEKEQHPEMAMNLRLLAQKELAKLGQDESFLIFQIVDPQHRVLRRSPDAPSKALALPLKSGYSEVDGLRVFTLKHPLEPIFIHVADPLEHRQHALWQTTLRLLLPLLAVLPLLAWVIGRVTRHALRSVGSVAAQIQRRSGDDLSPIDGSGLPTELQSIADNTNHLLQRLASALNTERALAANAAHELRTPLATTRLRLQGVLGHDLSDTSRHELLQAQDALERLSRRTEKLLQLSRAESGAALAHSVVNLGAVAAAVAQDFWSDPSLLERLWLEVPADTDVLVLGDFDALAIAVRNLVENAVRYAPGARIDIRVQAPATLCVRDQGPGVSADQRQTLTHRHVRHARNTAGFGLGMSIVHSIAERHQAQLELSSPPAGWPTGLQACLRLRPAPTTTEA